MTDLRVVQRLADPENLKQNEIEESLSQILLDLICLMLHQKEGAQKIWAEPLSVPVHVRIVTKREAFQS